MTPCRYPSCPRPACPRTRGLCRPHHARCWRAGTLDAVAAPPKAPKTPAFWAGVPCWACGENEVWCSGLCRPCRDSLSYEWRRNPMVVRADLERPDPDEPDEAEAAEALARLAALRREKASA